MSGNDGVRLRSLQPGDLGWVISRHGSIYAAEYGLDVTFEHMVAEEAAAMMRRFDPARDGGWIAELDGAQVGSAFVVGQEDNIARLRFVILDPSARGRGLGRLLVETAVAHARARGFARMTLWTMSMLTAARSIYAGVGFKCISQIPDGSFGREVVDEMWDFGL